ncbi:MAG: YbaN family protein [Pseudomonadota bacterium]
MLRRATNWLFVALGWLALGLGTVGIFVPLLPTTPFVLLAAFFFSKGSERLHQWLVNHPRIGHYVRDWEAEQVIPPIGKWASTLTMTPMVSWVIAVREIPIPLEAMMAGSCAAVLWFIWTRPSRRSPSVPPTQS